MRVAAALLLAVACIQPGCRQPVGGPGEDCFDNRTCQAGLTCFVEQDGDTCYPVGTLGERCRQRTRLCDPDLICGPDSRCCRDGGHSGEFVFANLFADSGGLNDLVAQDFNADGVTDFAVSGTDQQTGVQGISIILMDPESQFPQLDEPLITPAATYGTDNAPSELTWADFNGDQIVDLAAVIESTGKLTVLIGNGDGSFADPVEYDSPGANGLTVTDINQDGVEDIAVANKNYPVALFLGIGDGTFPPKLNGPDTPNGDFEAVSPKATIAGGELDGDATGELALVAGGGMANVATLEWDDATSTLTAGTSVQIGPEGKQYFLAGGDFNGDGVLDVAVSDELTNAVLILIGVGDGSFASPTEIDNVCADPGMIIDADLDADGIADLVVICWGIGEISVLMGNSSAGVGDGTFSQPRRYRIGQEGTNRRPEAVRTGDFNQDGLTDIVVLHSLQLGLMLGIGACGG